LHADWIKLGIRMEGEFTLRANPGARLSILIFEYVKLGQITL